uniref:Dynein heavy chain AAA lid domain-containing protein n=1 Tax=Acrobeloides nanus TaxID=290746 RepID=A0A914C3X1_9BILA
MNIAKVHARLHNGLKRQQLYKLCCFHFILMERSRYQPFGWSSPFLVRFDQFVVAIQLFEELSDLKEILVFTDIYVGILEMAYLQNVLNTNDVIVFKNLACWVFQGINKHDDSLLRPIWLKDYNQSVMSILAQISTIPTPDGEEEVLSGLSLAVRRYVKERRLSELHLTLTGEREKHKSQECMNEKPFRISNPINCSQPGTLEYCIRTELQFCVENFIEDESKKYFEKLLKTGDFQRLSLRYFRRPVAIFEMIKAQFAKDSLISYDESRPVLNTPTLHTFLFYVECRGSLKEPLASTPVLALEGCFLIGAVVDERHLSLKELTNHQTPFFPLKTVYVTVQRRMGHASSMIGIPLLHHSDHTLERTLVVLNVDVETHLPENHWLLRGVKILSSKP